MPPVFDAAFAKNASQIRMGTNRSVRVSHEARHHHERNAYRASHVFLKGKTSAAYLRSRKQGRFQSHDALACSPPLAGLPDCSRCALTQSVGMRNRSQNDMRDEAQDRMI